VNHAGLRTGLAAALGLALLLTLLQIHPAGFQEQTRLDVLDPTGTVDADRRDLRYTYHFDHNALIDAVFTGDTVIAATGSGNLLRFDAESLGITAQAVIPERATAVALDDRGVVLLGTEAGQIFSVNPLTLAHAELLRGSGSVRWLTRQGNRLAAVLAPPPLEPWPGERDPEFERRRRAQRPWAVLVHRNNRTVSYALPDDAHPNAMLIDGARLWLGEDRGEFGGQLVWMDLETGRVESKETEAIRGLTRAPDGRVLAYGGVEHLGIQTAFIATIEDSQVRLVPRFEEKRWLVRTEGQADEPDDKPFPRYPIDRIIEDRTSGGFWVLAAQRIHRASSDFAKWSRSVDLEGRWLAGRANSVGNTPTITTLLDGRAPGELIAISARDGFWRVSGDDVQRAAVSNQLEESIVDIWPTSLGTLFLGSRTWRDEAQLWSHSNAGWRAERLCPEQLEGVDTSFSTPVGDDPRGIFVYCEGATQGHSALVHRTDSGFTIVDAWREWREGSPDRFLVGPDGILLGMSRYADGSPDVLQAHIGGESRAVGAVTLPDWIRHLPGPAAREFITLSTQADSMLVWSVQEGLVLRLSAAANGAWRLEPVKQPPLKHILDAVPAGDGSVLAVTPRDILRYDPKTDKVVRLRSPKGDRIVTVARDVNGRLWAAGDRLHVSSDDGRNWQVVKLPMLSATRLKRLRRNPATPGGMIVSLYDRGVVFLD
jgi:hypothetical protein